MIDFNDGFGVVFIGLSSLKNKTDSIPTQQGRIMKVDLYRDFCRWFLWFVILAVSVR